MSGTSLDGIDLVYAHYFLNNSTWSFSIEETLTIPYADEWVNRLKSARILSGEDLSRLDIDLGFYYGKCIHQFIVDNNLKPDFICSHGHTVFHQPENKLTLQIGSGQAMNAITNLPVINDFRTLDVLRGGQGAPLVPIGDQLLFRNYDVCINLGGIANISYDENGIRKAHDICAFNLILNYFSQKEGWKFDNRGENAEKGKVNKEILQILEGIEFYKEQPPKSLGIEQVERDIIFPVEKVKADTCDILRTLAEHISSVVATEITRIGKSKILFTGGGVYNSFLLKLIREKLKGTTITIPEKEIVEFKEALIFGLLGILKVRGEVNILKSVTGAERDSSGGTIFGDIAPGML